MTLKEKIDHSMIRFFICYIFFIEIFFIKYNYAETIKNSLLMDDSNENEIKKVSLYLGSNTHYHTVTSNNNEQSQKYNEKISQFLESFYKNSLFYIHKYWLFLTGLVCIKQMLNYYNDKIALIDSVEKSKFYLFLRYAPLDLISDTVSSENKIQKVCNNFFESDGKVSYRDLSYLYEYVNYIENIISNGDSFIKYFNTKFCYDIKALYKIRKKINVIIKAVTKYLKSTI